MGDNNPLNPQRLLFKEAYCNPNSETFANAYGSAISAGFSEEYAKVITAPSKEVAWVAELVRDLTMLTTAEKVLQETMVMDTEGEPQLAKIRQDSAKFVASRLGKKKWAERTEVTGENGSPLSINLVAYADDHPAAQLPSTPVSAAVLPSDGQRVQAGDPSLGEASREGLVVHPLRGEEVV